MNQYEYETIQLCYKLIHGDYCAGKDGDNLVWHDVYVEHICNRLENIIQQYNQYK